MRIIQIDKIYRYNNYDSQIEITATRPSRAGQSDGPVYMISGGRYTVPEERGTSRATPSRTTTTTFRFRVLFCHSRTSFEDVICDFFFV